MPAEEDKKVAAGGKGVGRGVGWVGNQKANSEYLMEG